MSEKKHDGANHRGAERSSPYGLSRLAPQVKLIDVAREIQEADETIGRVTSVRLRLIAEQIRHLQSQAQGILETAKRDLDLHRAKCSFTRTPGQIYHLYEKANGQLIWSILSPEDWGIPPHAHRGSYRLEGDQSWTPVEEISEAEQEDPFASEAIVRHLLPPPEQ